MNAKNQQHWATMYEKKILNKIQSTVTLLLFSFFSHLAHELKVELLEVGWLFAFNNKNHNLFMVMPLRWLLHINWSSTTIKFFFNTA